MTTIAVTLVKDEADVIAATVGQMLTQVDEVIVADNGSTDGTRDILAGMDVTIIDDPEIGYYQSAKMSMLAAVAYDRGARWVVPFDADEWWMSVHGRVAEVLEALNGDYGIVKADVFDHVVTGRDDPDEDDPTVRIGWRRLTALPLPKIACRATDGLVIEQGNHGAKHPIPARWTEHGRLTVHHYPYRSVAQVVRKVRNGAAAYAATGTDFPTNVGQHWREWGAFSDDELAELFETWYRVEDPRRRLVDGEWVDAGLCYDPPA